MKKISEWQARLPPSAMLNPVIPNHSPILRAARACPYARLNIVAICSSRSEPSPCPTAFASFTVHSRVALQITTLPTLHHFTVLCHHETGTYIHINNPVALIKTRIIYAKSAARAYTKSSGNEPHDCTNSCAVCLTTKPPRLQHSTISIRTRPRRFSRLDGRPAMKQPLAG